MSMKTYTSKFYDPDRGTDYGAWLTEFAEAMYEASKSDTPERSMSSAMIKYGIWFRQS